MKIALENMEIVVPVEYAALFNHDEYIDVSERTLERWRSVLEEVGGIQREIAAFIAYEKKKRDNAV